VLRRLAATPGDASVLPVIDGTAQPLCARWSAEDLDAAAVGFAAGERSLRRHPRRRTAILLDETDWGDEAAGLRDADTPADLASIGIALDAVPNASRGRYPERPATPGHR
jgi:molybdopterin-guanine dinucleotide biosynthesis protein A